MGGRSQVLGGLLTNLISYTVAHFRAEEKLMQAANFPGYLAHKSEHDKLTSKVRDLKARFDAGHSTVSLQTMDFLRDWVKAHICGTDRQYGPCLSKAAQPV